MFSRPSGNGLSPDVRARPRKIGNITWLINTPLTAQIVKEPGP